MKRLRKEKVLGLLKEMHKGAKVYCPQFQAEKDLMLLPLGEGVFKGEIVQKHDQPAAAVAAALAGAVKPEPAPDAPSADRPKKPRAPRKPGAKPGTRSGAKNAATRKA